MEGSRNCYFLIVPRFRIRSEGSVVYYHDAILFESELGGGGGGGGG